ncbi:MAG: rod shape-determining protein MreD [Bacteroidota bacterium]
MLNNYLKPVLYFIPLAVIQLVLVPLISIDNVAPNFILILVVYYTLRNGQIFGMLLGFGLGFIFDLISGGLIGAFMFSFTVSAFVTGFFYNENKFDTNLASYFFLVILFVSSFVCLFIFGSISNSSTNIGFLFLIVEEGILPAIYTTLFGILLVVFSSKKGLQ